MTALQKLNSPPQLPQKRLNQSQIIGNPFLLDDKQFKKYQKIISRFIGTKYDTASIYDLINKIINWGLLPSDYHQRHIMRLMAQGIYIKPSILEAHDIVIYDGLPQGLQRRKPEKRLPKNPYDFVLIDTAKWGDYPALQRFYEQLPNKPYASLTKDSEALILGKEKAKNLPYIQPNHPLVTSCLVFDIDEQQGRCAFTTWQEYNLPPPNIIVKNPMKDSCHYIYLLAKPIGKGGKSSKKPIIKLDFIYDEMRIRLGADPSYAGARMKNPLSRKHDCFVNKAKPYTLDELADKLDFPELDDLPPFRLTKRNSEPLEPQGGYLGRNHAIFDNIRHTGYKNASMGLDSLRYFLLTECERYNQTHFSHDLLPSNELWGIADSIARFCKSNRFGIYSEDFIKKQSIAGQKGNSSNGGKARSASYDDQREEAKRLRETGLSIRKIAEQMKVSKTSVQKWTNV